VTRQAGHRHAVGAPPAGSSAAGKRVARPRAAWPWSTSPSPRQIPRA